MVTSRFYKTQIFLNQIKKIFILSLVFFVYACGSGSDRTPEEHMAKAKVHLENREVMEAIIELKNALQQESNLPEARWLLGQAYLKLGDGGLAYREFNSAQSLGYSDPQLENNLLRALAKQGKHQEVLDRTETAAAAENVADDILVIRGNSYLSLRELDQAEEIFSSLLASNPDLVDAHLGLARVAFGRNDIKKAEQHLNDALDIDTENDDVWTLKGLAALISTDLAKAEDSFSRAVALAPYNVSAYIGLVRSQLALGKKEEAKKHLAIIEKYNKNIPIVRYFRAYLKYQEGDLEAAIVILQDILKVIPEHPEATLLLSNILYQEKKLEQVIGYLSKFNKQFPTHVPAAKLLAVSYVSKNNPDKAIDVLEKILPTNPDDSQILALLGSAYLRIGDMEKGAELLERAAEISPDAAEIKTQLALSHLASGSASQAVSELETALEINPNLYSADILLILTHIREKDFEKAIVASRKLSEKDPKNPLPLNLIGSAHVAAKDFDKARESFEAALKLKKDFLPALFNLAALDIEQGDLESAEKRYKEILKINEGNQKAFIALSKMASDKGNTEEMLDYLIQARAANPNGVESRFYLARYYLSVSDAKNMLDVVTEMDNLSPDNPEIMFLLAKANRLNGKVDEAFALLEELNNDFPKSENILIELSSALVNKQRIDEGIEKLEEVLELNPKNQQALLGLINLRIRTSDFSITEELISTLEQYYPDKSSLYMSRGDLEYARQDYLAAIGFYKQAMEKQGSNVVMFRLYEAYRSANDEQNAKAVLDNWVEQHPQDTKALNLSASTYQAQGDNEKAIVLYEKTLLDKNNDVIALNNLAWLYYLKEDPKALEYAEKAYKLAPAVPEVMDTLGWILANQKQVERAIGLLNTASSKRPDLPAIAYHLAYALEKSGEKDKAVSILSKIIREHPDFDEREDAQKLLNQLQ